MRKREDQTKIQAPSILNKIKMPNLSPNDGMKEIYPPPDLSSELSSSSQ